MRNSRGWHVLMARARYQRSAFGAISKFTLHSASLFSEERTGLNKMMRKRLAASCHLSCESCSSCPLFFHLSWRMKRPCYASRLTKRLICRRGGKRHGPRHCAEARGCARRRRRRVARLLADVQFADLEPVVRRRIALRGCDDERVAYHIAAVEARPAGGGTRRVVVLFQPEVV